MHIQVRNCGKVEDFDKFWEGYSGDIETFAEGAAAMIAPWYALYRPFHAGHLDGMGLTEIAADLVEAARDAVKYAIQHGSCTAGRGRLSVEAFQTTEGYFELNAHLNLATAEFWETK
jgi:hypothetical protein